LVYGGYDIKPKACTEFESPVDMDNKKIRCFASQIKNPKLLD
jgi:hypothetical protein